MIKGSFNIFLVAKQFCKNIFHLKMFYVLYAIFLVLVLFASYNGWKNYTVQNNTKLEFQKQVRESWENNPDKHPHRMAHYGSFAFRLKHKMSMFDNGIENFAGNVVFLEAHKQNTVNFSEANLSASLLRFGEISLSMLLQIILPLIIFFLGFNAISQERENATLKILFIQGINWKQLLFGKSLGLFLVALLFYIPVFIVLFLLLNIENAVSDEHLRLLFVAISYLLFIVITSVITVSVSAFSTRSKQSLVKLLGIWLLMTILLPKTMQALGNYFYQTPTMSEFNAKIEADLIKLGDSHNPNDLHYRKIKDSLLLTFKVDSVQKLPFNYGGFIMKEGERLSAKIYIVHQKKLFELYKKQNNLNNFTAILNPFTAIKNISMALSGTNFSAYADFQNQAEKYRYDLAQNMNELQIKYISNKKLGETDKPYKISNSFWKQLPDFSHQFLNIGVVFKSILFEIVSLCSWLVGIIFSISIIVKKLKIV